jgi:hypothetical protein
MFLSFQFFPVCFRETVKIMLFTLTVYAITIKKIRNRQGIWYFPDGYVHSQVNYEFLWRLFNFPECFARTVKIISIFLCVFHKPSR